MRLLDWLFRNRSTGRYTVAQLPNWPLGVWLAVSVVRWIAHPVGTVGTVLHVVATGALLVWAIDELVRGVNPWRRALGAATAAVVLAGLLSQ